MSDYGICTRLPENKEAIDIHARLKEHERQVWAKVCAKPAPTRRWWEVWK